MTASKYHHPHCPPTAYPFEGLNFTAEEINALLASIQDKVNRGEIKDGASAYEIAQKHGYQGTEEEWLQSLRGPKGEPLRFEDLTVEQLDELKLPAVLAAEIVKEQTEDAIATMEEKTGEAIEQAGEAAREAWKWSHVKWYPNVDVDGNISWHQTASVTPPKPANIKGPAGKDGITGSTDDLIVVKDFKGEGPESGKSYVMGACLGPRIQRIMDDVSVIQANTPVYNISRFHQHSGFWEAVKYDPDAEAYSSKHAYEEGSIVNLVNYTAYSFRATRQLAGCQPDHEDISDIYVLEEAVFFVPYPYRMKGISVDFYNTSSHPVRYRFDGGEFTNPANWKYVTCQEQMVLEIGQFLYTGGTLNPSLSQTGYDTLVEALGRGKLLYLCRNAATGGPVQACPSVALSGADIVLSWLEPCVDSKGIRLEAKTLRIDGESLALSETEDGITLETRGEGKRCLHDDGTYKESTPAYLDVVPSELSFTPEGGEQEVEIQTNQAWNAQAETETDTEPEPSELDVRPGVLEFPAIGGTDTFQIESNDEWTITNS